MNPSRVPYFLILAFGFCLVQFKAAGDSERPNILWLTSEDNGPHLGCYGDRYADTPHIDGIASKGMIYLNCWSTAPVCAPARTTLISGIYPPSTGSQHMRSQTSLPPEFKMYPQYLREIGYYCTNNSKEDYNLAKPGKVWDESSRRAHWKNRKPDQPFFAVFNFTVSHESQIRKRPHKAIHDPSEVRVPAYHPDTPEVRTDWAQYYDKVTEMDAMVGKALKELEEAGLQDETIIFYYGDHGSGMPRNKRWTYNSGLRVPLVIHVPEKYKHLAPADYSVAGQTDRLVGFIDFPATLLSLVGIRPPEHFQGFAFMGLHQTKDPSYIHGFRDRMDERYDMVRSVRNKRYIYIRNYKPHKKYGQYIDYMFQTPTTRVWHDMYVQGKLQPPMTHFWETKPAEELYDLWSDPDEVKNLVHSPRHAQIVKELKKAQQEHAIRIRDLGFLPELEIHTRSEGSTPYRMGHDNSKYPMERIMKVAEAASSLKTGDVSTLTQAVSDSDSAVRYWAVLGLLMRGDSTVQSHLGLLRNSLNDSSEVVQIIAAQALGQFGSNEDAEKAATMLVRYADMNQHNTYVAMLAMNALDVMDERAMSVKETIEGLPRKSVPPVPRVKGYVGNLIKKTLMDL